MRGILYPAVWLLAGLAFCHAARANVFVVNVGGSAGLAFQPAFLDIAPGDTVVFVNKGGFHNVNADDGSFTCSVGCKGDGKGDTGAPSSANWTFNLTFPNPGRFGYYCVIHGAPGMGMFGTIIVQAPQPPPTAPSPAPAIGTALALLLVVLLTLLAAVRLCRRG
ncbi:MAG: cupredoxin domain-containing protein [Rudaea sp.]